MARVIGRSQGGTGCPCPAPPGAPNQGATCHAVSFRRKRTPKPISAKTPLKNPRHGLLRALVQEWTDMNCKITSANNVSGPQADISRISTVQLAVSVRKSTSSRPFICPILCNQLRLTDGSWIQPQSWQIRFYQRSSHHHTVARQTCAFIGLGRYKSWIGSHSDDVRHAGVVHQIVCLPFVIGT